MSTSLKNINNLQSLEKEISRLQLHARQLEEKMDDRLDYFQDNYPGMMMKSLFPGMRQGTDLPATILHVFMQSERLQDTLGKLITHLFDKASDWLELLMDKLFNKHK